MCIHIDTLCVAGDSEYPLRVHTAGQIATAALGDLHAYQAYKKAGNNPKGEEGFAELRQLACGLEQEVGITTYSTALS